MSIEDVIAIKSELTVICFNPDCDYVGEMTFDGYCPLCGEQLD